MKRVYKKPTHGFTIVELLVVIVVIGILAAITIVSYTGISQRAKVASLQSDLSNASTQIKLSQATDASGNYPTANTCPTPGATEICLKASGTNTYSYSPLNASNPKTFTLDATNGTTSYRITNDSTPAVVVPLTVSDPANWLAVGTQVWAKANLNLGTIISGETNQTDNANLEKYCYDDDESNCTNYGALYQWNEAMQYVTTEGAQGICPVGSHIPSDNDWKILEIQLGMTQEQADFDGGRGTNQSTQLISGGSSGLNVPLAGRRYTDGFFYSLPSSYFLWTSSEADTDVWNRYSDPRDTKIHRYVVDVANGISVRCIEN